MGNAARYDGVHWADVLAACYYELLNGNADFAADLARLFAGLDVLRLPDDLNLDDATLLSALEVLSRWPMVITTKEELEGLEWATSHLERARLAAKAKRLIDELCARWRLPKRAADDLYWSYWARPAEGRLVCHGAAAEGLPRTSVRQELVRMLHDSAIGAPTGPVEVYEVVRVGRPLPWIRVRADERFQYDPLLHDRKWLEERIEGICRNIRESALRQAEVQERRAAQAKWEKTEPRWGHVLLVRLALRLYRRAVLKLSWEEIAELDGGDRERDGRYGTVDAMRRTTARAAEMLGICLP
ncbi:MAG: hypothetical protein M1389_10400 [Chloroflexi bacterium]|nr:hypothetical protein [Chloroflexota bacterium]